MLTLGTSYIFYDIQTKQSRISAIHICWIGILCKIIFTVPLILQSIIMGNSAVFVHKMYS